MRKRLLFLIASITVILITVVGCIKNENDNKKDPFYENAPIEPNKNKLLELVNNYRQSGCNCGSKYFPPAEPVVWNGLLENAAKIHSNDMNQNNFFNHIGSNGNGPGDRISYVGYVWVKCGENIAKGYKSENDVIISWIKSEGHCTNIMDPNFKDMGVATSGIYWTQVFGAK